MNKNNGPNRNRSFGDGDAGGWHYPLFPGKGIYHASSSSCLLQSML